jgi:tetratricopeptide (TPR) repeat protein
MLPDTILISTGCDLKRLPLDASEAFLLTQIDGQLTLEEIGEVAGLGLDKTRRLAERLLVLGAVKPINATASAAPTSRRIDPRAEEEVTPSRPPTDTVIVGPKPARRPEPKPRRASSRALKAQRPVVPAPAADEPCELDDATQKKLFEMDALCKRATHYELLGVPRDADRKEIKRAYFALAAAFHPDRFFGRKLGPMRPVLDRVFVKLTQANESLGSRQLRDAYDATLPPAPATAPKAEPVKRPSSRGMPAARTSKRLRRSQLMGAVAAPKSEPKVEAKVEVPPESKPQPISEPAPASVSPVSERERFQRLQATAKMMASQSRAEALVKAAEEALHSGDIMGAANNYRLALQMHDDPVVRDKLAALDRHTRDLRYEKYLLKARASERAERWDEAADSYVRANDARRDAAVAERAANALRLANGDLRQATSLAEQAVAENGKNADYRITLAEVLMAAKLFVRAKEEADEAVALSPNNARAKSIAAAVKKLG